MRRRKVDSSRERRILSAMVVSRDFLSRISGSVDLDLINGDHFKQVAEWCLNYFKEYADAPKNHIEDIFMSWSESENRDQDTVDSIQDFLESLSEEYDKDPSINVPFLVDDLASLLSSRKVSRLQEQLEEAMAEGDHKAAENSITAFRRIEIGQGAGVDLVNDLKAWEAAFAEPSTPLFEFGGDAGKFFNHVLTRDSLVGIQAPEKTGKTFWCLEFMFRAMRNRRKVAMFQVGDLSQTQVLLRVASRISDRPIFERQKNVEIPYKVTVTHDPEDDLPYSVLSKSRTFSKNITLPFVKKKLKKLNRTFGLPKGKPFYKLSVHANSSINVQGISSILDQWATEDDFIPDVIIIDYADILAPEDPKKDGRGQINDTWKSLRRLSQERHALVIVPTQADAGTYSETPKLQTMKNFSEDKRKYSHVNGMFALNQCPAERDMQGMRLNWLVLREAPFNSNRCLYVGTCFALGRALCCASF